MKLTKVFKTAMDLSTLLYVAFPTTTKLDSFSLISPPCEELYTVNTVTNAMSFPKLDTSDEVEKRVLFRALVPVLAKIKDE